MTVSSHSRFKRDSKARFPDGNLLGESDPNFSSVNPTIMEPAALVLVIGEERGTVH